MSLWRRTAIGRFPHLHRMIADADNIGYLWFELRHALEDKYCAVANLKRPLNEQLVADIYEYAHWCLTHRSIKIRTAVVIDFYEDLADNILLRPDLARWMSQEDFDLLEFAWRYALKGEETVNAFQQEFAARKAELSSKGSRRHRNSIKRAGKAANFVAEN